MMGVTAKIRTEAETALLATYASAPEQGAKTLRDAAMARFAQEGLPHRRVEAWHYTDLRSHMRHALPIAAPTLEALDSARKNIAARNLGDAIKLVIVDGVFQAALSDLAHLPEGLVVQSLQRALVKEDADFIAVLAPQGLSEDDSIVTLNAAMMSDGVVITIAPGVRIAQPIALITLLSSGAPKAAFTRSFVQIGQGASAKLLDISANAGVESQSNEALVLVLADDSALEIVADTRHTGDQAIHLHSLIATLGARVNLATFTYAPDPTMTRRQIFARLEGEHTKIALRGLSLLRENQHGDTTLIVNHIAPHCESRELFRTIVDDEATGVFQGKAVVQSTAQKTDGGMKSQALLLSDSAVMLNKPELEIFADDVVCGHGATVGALDDNQVFYLQARGIPRPEAEAMLLEAFAAEVLEFVSDDSLREKIAADVSARLQQRLIS